LRKFVTHIIPFSLLALTITLFGGGSAMAQIADYAPESLRKIDVIEQLGEQVPEDIMLVNANGDSLLLGEYFQEGKPLVLALAYYECPMLCTMVLNGLTETADKLDWRPGEDYSILTVSIDPGESAELAMGKQKVYLESFKGELGQNAWRFHVSKQTEVTRLAEAVGFKYYYDEESDEYAHPAVLMLLSPDGKVARYLYGLTPTETDLKLGLLEASEGKIGNTIDRLILYCYHYDSQAGSYSLVAANVMRLGGAVTVLVLGAFLGILWYWDRQHRRKLAPLIKERRNTE
jgi:protein SCO1/2